MNALIAPASTADPAAPEETVFSIHRALEHAAHFLPAQGPIGVFIHHNTLHAFEHLTFDEAVLEGERHFGCEPYASEARYRAELARGRIRPEDLDAELARDLAGSGAESVAGLTTRLDLRRAMLREEIAPASGPELHWHLAQTAAMERFAVGLEGSTRDRLLADTRRWVMRDLVPSLRPEGAGRTAEREFFGRCEDILAKRDLRQADAWTDRAWESLTLELLWRAIAPGVRPVPPPSTRIPPVFRTRDRLLARTGDDSDLLVHEILIPFCAAFLDQGLATWTPPARDRGFLESFTAVFGAGSPGGWRRGMAERLRLAVELGADGSIERSLGGLSGDERDSIILGSLLALRGWAGMIHQCEIRPDRTPRPVPPGTLKDYLAVRLILEEFATRHIAARNGIDPAELTAGAEVGESGDERAERRTFILFHLAQRLGWTPDRLIGLDRSAWGELVAETESFGSRDRRRIFHRAFERRYRLSLLDALSAHSRHRSERLPAPRFQTICCIDEREESFNRHLEEIEPRLEAFSAAGFFAVPIYFRGVGEAHYKPLCPIVMKPSRYVEENVLSPLAADERRRRRARRVLGGVWRRMQAGSRGFALGAVLSAGLGAIASIPLVLRVLSPRLAARMEAIAGRAVRPPPVTRIEIERTADPPGPDDDHVGFRVDEMADMIERLLRDLGLTTSFAPLIAVIGHGSDSVNNPHVSAYNCGACGGSAGGPNARAVARLANDPRVRTLLANRGLPIPESTSFIGGYHNTCDDSVIWFDVDQLPPSGRREFEKLAEVVAEATRRNAQERCRRFGSAPLDITPEDARRHVENRAEDLAQVRPELGHATNAVCTVARRSRTRGLFMDRRSFLVSYDPTLDDDRGSILERLLSAVVPVCTGINLEYYFSHVDSAGYGCGTKLPHNVTSLLGVMDGAASDLRTGLPWQMVEIHEPMRLLFVLEQSPEVIRSIMDRNPVIGGAFRNGWAGLALIQPSDGAIMEFTDDAFHPHSPERQTLPRVRSSAEWYRGQRDHLGFCAIDAEGAGS
jgi:hypothetical protein